MRSKILPLILLIAVCLQITSCDNDDVTEFVDPVNVTVPVIKSKTALRNSISIQSPQPTNSDGKIYIYENLLFYIAQNSGIHIFNNQNPATPENLVFIQLEGVHDISVKNNMLYADNFMDLVVMDISNISNIQIVNIEEDLLSFYAPFPNEIEFYQSNINTTNDDEFVAGYRNVTMERTEADNNPDIYDWNSTLIQVLDVSAITNTVGTGGSYAKFQIYNNALYTIDDYILNTFDITDYNSISLASQTYMLGWFAGILETTFIQDEHLFIGATNGMHIVDLSEELTPTYVSSFSHATGCDPVVVEGNTAYITVRGGNSCGAIEDQVNVIDVSDITSPVEYSTYFLSSPYGLGVKNDVLFVCNDNGINVFDAQNPNNIILKNTYQVSAKDVIPLSTHLIAVGENVIHQYRYISNYGLQLISTINF